MQGQCQQIKILIFNPLTTVYKLHGVMMPGMGPQLAWKPDGSLLATDCKTPSGHCIMFFEKNGLHRYDLKLTSNLTVKKIQWNGTGDILMIWQHDNDHMQNNSDEIQLWTCSNFYWYKKQSLIFTKDEPVNYVSWCDKQWLEVVTIKKLFRYCWKRVPNVSNSEVSMKREEYVETLLGNLSINDTKDLGAITVIDGNILHVTVTSLQIVPPPMDSYKIQFDKPINFVTFGSESGAILVVFNDYTIKIMQLNTTSYKEVYALSIPVSSHTAPLTLNHFVYDDIQKTLYCVESLVDGSSTVNMYRISEANNSLCTHTYYTTSETITDLIRIKTPDGIHLGICAGIILMICETDFDNESTLVPIQDIVLQDSFTDGGGYKYVQFNRNEYHIFSLNKKSFYYNDEKVLNNVTSFIFCKNYLLLTTTENQLLCIRLSSKALAQLELRDTTHFYKRSIPTGALLVNDIPNTSKVVLQVPRGELEIINPRPIALDQIDKLLSQKRHLEAYKIMRADRIDSNVLYDLDPARFMNDIEEFIKNINNCEYIDVIITQMLDCNVAEDLYKNCFEEKQAVQKSGTKLHEILNAFIETMKTIDVNYFLQSIITAYLCKGGDTNLELALKELVQAKQRQESGIKLRVPVDSTLEHMILMSSVETIYTIALGMDKLDLIMWISSKSQQDPLEYIPFLHELIDMEDNYRNFKINSHIKRFEKALKYLIKCDNVLDELQEFISKNKLYKLIMNAVEPSNQWFQPLMQVYVDYLQTEEQYKEAGLVSIARNDYKSAANYFVKACCMKETLAAVSCVNFNATERNIILSELGERLIADQNYFEASQLYEIYLDNYEQAISILLQAKLWSDAYYLALKYNRRDIIDSEIKVQILSYTENLTSSFSTLEEEFRKINDRLQDIRTEKIAMFKQNGGQMFDMDDELQGADQGPGRDFDLDSLVSTNCSTAASHRTKSSSSSATSSRRKKRLQQKKMQIREGTIFENIAIIRRLHIIITDLVNFSQTVNDTCSVLLLFPDCYERGITVQSSYEHFLDFVVISSQQIWPPEMLLPPNPMTNESHVYRMNIEHLEIQYRTPPQDIKKNWKKILSFSKNCS
ncbi:Elongator complex protein 1 [Carabus blaptoides fortunei]